MAAAASKHNLDRMLELERRLKLQRLQSQPPPARPSARSLSLQSYASSQPPLSSSSALRDPDAPDPDGPPMPQQLRPDNAMVRSSTMPLDVPRQAAAQALRSDDRPDFSRSKTVSFITPPPPDDVSSDESSICNSPSWQGYDAARRRRRDERRANAARLVKQPPSTKPFRLDRPSDSRPSSRSSADSPADAPSWSDKRAKRSKHAAFAQRDVTPTGKGSALSTRADAADRYKKPAPLSIRPSSQSSSSEWPTVRQKSEAHEAVAPKFYADRAHRASAFPVLETSAPGQPTRQNTDPILTVSPVTSPSSSTSVSNVHTATRPPVAGATRGRSHSAQGRAQLLIAVTASKMGFRRSRNSSRDSGRVIDGQNGSVESLPAHSDQPRQQPAQQPQLQAPESREQKPESNERGRPRHSLFRGRRQPSFDAPSPVPADASAQEEASKRQKGKKDGKAKESGGFISGRRSRGDRDTEPLRLNPPIRLDLDGVPSRKEDFFGFLDEPFSPFRQENARPGSSSSMQGSPVTESFSARGRKRQEKHARADEKPVDLPPEQCTAPAKSGSTSKFRGLKQVARAALGRSPASGSPNPAKQPDAPSLVVEPPLASGFALATTPAMVAGSSVPNMTQYNSMTKLAAELGSPYGDLAPPPRIMGNGGGPGHAAASHSEASSLSSVLMDDSPGPLPSPSTADTPADSECSRPDSRGQGGFDLYERYAKGERYDRQTPAAPQNQLIRKTYGEVAKRTTSTSLVPGAPDPRANRAAQRAVTATYGEHAQQDRENSAADVSGKAVVARRSKTSDNFGGDDRRISFMTNSKNGLGVPIPLLPATADDRSFLMSFTSLEDMANAAVASGGPPSSSLAVSGRRMSQYHQLPPPPPTQKPPAQQRHTLMLPPPRSRARAPSDPSVVDLRPKPSQDRGRIRSVTILNVPITDNAKDLIDTLADGQKTDESRRHSRFKLSTSSLSLTGSTAPSMAGARSGVVAAKADGAAKPRPLSQAQAVYVSAPKFISQAPSAAQQSSQGSSKVWSLSETSLVSAPATAGGSNKAPRGQHSVHFSDTRPSDGKASTSRTGPTHRDSGRRHSHAASQRKQAAVSPARSSVGAAFGSLDNVARQRVRFDDDSQHGRGQGAISSGKEKASLPAEKDTDEPPTSTALVPRSNRNSLNLTDPIAAAAAANLINLAMAPPSRRSIRAPPPPPAELSSSASKPPPERATNGGSHGHVRVKSATTSAPLGAGVGATPANTGKRAASHADPAKPLAKMLVECCSCRFFHDMPSRLYECIANPDTVVEDAALGVSGAVTTLVKCPWCRHEMSARCCAGYAAVIYLKERLH